MQGAEVGELPEHVPEPVLHEHLLIEIAAADRKCFV